MSYDALLINTSIIYNITNDKWGARSEITIPNVKCRIMFGNRIVRDFRGEEVRSSAKIFYKANAVINPEDHIDVDGSGRKRAVLKILKPQDSTAIHHIEVYVE